MHKFNIISNNTRLKCALMVFKQKMKKYIINLSMVLKLELCIVVQLLHISITRFWFDIEEKARQKKKQTKICDSSNHNINTVESRL